MGDYLLSNTEKLQRSKAKADVASYGPWLLSEFFVELFALLQDGKDMGVSFSDAYTQTLQNHQNMFQRKAFKSAAKKLPNREELFELLGGGASNADVAQDIKSFVD